MRQTRAQPLKKLGHDRRVPWQMRRVEEVQLDVSSANGPELHEIVEAGRLDGGEKEGP